ncbi:MAG: hypothetical protein K1W17_11595 [Oscillospiraceae bacterium]
MPLRKKYFSVLAAAVLVCSLVGCQRNDVPTVQEQTSTVINNTIIPEVIEKETEAETKSETTAAPQNAEINIETLAEGEERDYIIEDILKNSLKIGGIPISIPCTLNEFLEALGDDYSVEKSQFKDFFDGEANSKTKYYTGKFLPIDLYFNGENTYNQIYALSANTKEIDYDDIYVIGYIGGSGIHNYDLGLSNLTIGDSLDKCIECYGSPNEVNSGINERIYLAYEDDDCFISITVRDNVVKYICAEFKIEDLQKQ